MASPKLNEFGTDSLISSQTFEVWPMGFLNVLPPVLILVG